VLYVDDDYHITRLARKALERYGMEIEIENDSTKALAVLEQSLSDFDVLVTDQIMPSITGLELAQRILIEDPNFPIILCTGYSESVTPEITKSIGIKGLLFKPTDFQEMATLIQHVYYTTVRPVSLPASALATEKC
jgi:DNA-binding NtrC family response regulator